MKGINKQKVEDVERSEGLSALSATRPTLAQEQGRGGRRSGRESVFRVHLACVPRWARGEMHQAVQKHDEVDWTKITRHV